MRKITRATISSRMARKAYKRLTDDYKRVRLQRCRQLKRRQRWVCLTVDDVGYCWHRVREKGPGLATAAVEGGLQSQPNLKRMTTKRAILISKQPHRHHRLHLEVEAAEMEINPNNANASSSSAQPPKRSNLVRRGSEHFSHHHTPSKSCFGDDWSGICI